MFTYGIIGAGVVGACFLMTHGDRGDWLRNAMLMLLTIFAIGAVFGSIVWVATYGN